MDEKLDKKLRILAEAAKYEPGLVSVPNGRHRVGHGVPILVRVYQGKENPDTEIKAIHDDVHH